MNHLEKLIDLWSRMDDQSYLTALIAYRIAPTLALKKPASLLSFSRNRRDHYSLWEKHKDGVEGRLHLKFTEIRRTGESVLVLFYDADALKKTIFTRQNRDFLRLYGYGNEMDLNRHLEFLQKRFRSGFPHEIGIFLGIPLEDVRGFIENRGKRFLLNKYWKVYHNQERARDIFHAYDRARREMMASLSEPDLKLSV
ncbi:hypothetical protein DCMF_24815 [Candidatus Formimonas warabiya]|uniref:DUF3793 family protein n=2 Tax=Formimonas warabiya TaxID=1761012 RepID=A0A3G1KYU6_FORW1|nr:hypothetical protein DCMF_24815 [Candidatus Formimonas warabiya]